VTIAWLVALSSSGESAYAQQAQTFHGTMERIEPAANGPGIIICDPVVDQSKTDLTNLGMGISEWLVYYVAGAPQCSKTPFWRSLDRVKSELHRENLQLTSSDGLRTLEMTGATHVVVSTISGTADQCTFSLQVLKSGSPTALGGPIVIAGSTADLPGKLPKVAKEIASRVGLKIAPLNTHLSKDQLSMLGEMRWSNKKSDANRQAALLQLAQTEALAGFIFLDRSGERDLSKLKPVIVRVVKQNPQNGLIYGELGWIEPKLLGGFAPQLARNVSSYPNHYLFSTALTYFWRIRQKQESELAQAVESIKSSIRNPEAWLTLGQTLSGMASSVRQQRFADQLNADEKTALDALYKRWLGAVEEAVKIDPLFGRAWLRVSAAACSAGCKQEAETAYQKAYALCQERYDVFWWGLQLYQRKWLNDMNKLREVAQSAGNDKRLSKGERQRLVNEIKDAYPELEVLIKASTAATAPD
jgi:hypothetical protein